MRERERERGQEGVRERGMAMRWVRGVREARVKERKIICIYFKYPHPHNQKMRFFFIRETILLHTRVEEGVVCHLLLEIARRQPPKDNIAFSHSSVKENGVTL